MHRLNLCKEYTMVSKGIVLFVLIVLYMSMAAPCAFAHNVLLTAYVEGDTVFVEGGFSDGTSCKNATIEVFDPSGKKLLEGKTDEYGEFSFKSPQKADLMLVLNAGMGHRGEYTVPADELPDIVIDDQASGTEAIPAPADKLPDVVIDDQATGTKAIPAPANELPDVVTEDQASGTEAMPVPTAETQKSQASENIARIDPKEIESIVDRVIQKRLAPLTRLVAKSQRKTGFSPTEIFGGIGYILGLMGIAMYFRYRKSGKS